MRLAVALLAALALAACGEDGNDDFVDPGTGGTGGGGGAAGTGGGGGTGGTGGIGGSGGSGGVVEPFVWEGCPSGPGECAIFDVPLDWDAPQGEQLPFFVRRFPSDEPGAKGQLWLLEGGPGVAGWAMNNAVPYFQRLAPGYDIYVPDYRGVGYSSWLGCEGQPGDTNRAGCRADLLEQWGDKLQHFTTTDTAKDIGNTIARLRQPNERVYLYSVSYGTFLANRYLTLFPEQADGVVLDSVCPATGCDVRMDRNYSLVVEHVFSDLCAADELCTSKLGPNPWQRALDVLDSFEDGHCSDFVGYPSNRQLVEIMLALTATSLPETLPVTTSVVYRAERCSPEDVLALENLADKLLGAGPLAMQAQLPELADERSAYLGNHIVYSEFWPAGLDLDAVEAELATLPVRIGALEGRAQDRARWTWPSATTPESLVHWADTSSPVLLLNGDLDAQTHLTGLAGVEQHFDAPGQQFVEVPLATHGTVFAGLQKWSDVTCGMQLIEDFFAEPLDPVDTACTKTPPAVDFAGIPGMAEGVYGTSDLWENAAPDVRALAVQPDPRLQQAFARMRTQLGQMTRF